MERGNLPYVVIGMALLGLGLLTFAELGVVSFALMGVGIILLVRSQDDAPRS